MANYEYAELFLPGIQKLYEAELTSDFLTKSNQDITFINAQTIKVPTVSMSGYGAHNRGSLNFNAGKMVNDWEPYKLAWDRDVEFAIDPEDVDETNKVLSLSTKHAKFEKEVTIPEKESYRYSKLYKEAVKVGSTVDKTVLTAQNILSVFDSLMEAMDEKHVTGKRVLVVTPHTKRLLKTAEGIQRTLEVTGKANIDRNVYSLDEVEIKVVSSAFMKTAYEDKQASDGTFTYEATADAGQINMILVEASAVICRDKYSYINIFEPGHDSRTADKYIYQNRYYGDLFIIPQKSAGVAMNVTITE